MNIVLTFLENNRQRLNLERYGVKERLSSVMLTPRFRASSHVVFLVLTEDRPDPVLVAKVPRLAGASAGVEREVANLRSIQAGRTGGFDSIPRVIAFEEYRGRPILVETALVGRPMDPATVRRDLAGCCEAVIDWLADVQQSACNPNSSISLFTEEREGGWFKQLVEQPLHHFADWLPLSVEEEWLLDRTWELIAPLREMNIPLVVEHGDLSHPNVMLLEDGKPGVVDWELADPYGLPACDLFFFLTYAAFARHKVRSTGDYLPAFQTAFFGPVAWARSYVRTYAKRLQLPLSILTPLFVLGWLRYMTSLLIRFGNAKRSQKWLGDETVTWLRTNRYYTLWRYTVTHANELDWYQQ